MVLIFTDAYTMLAFSRPAFQVGLRVHQFRRVSFLFNFYFYSISHWHGTGYIVRALPLLDFLAGDLRSFTDVFLP